jgi:outer membrane protein OmpA-like peptidoglycan-associated protein
LIHVKKNISLVLMIFLSFYLAEIYPQIKPGPIDHAFSGNFVFGLDAGLTNATTDYKNNKIGFSLRGSGEYFFPASSSHIFGLRLTFGTETISGTDPRSQISTVDGPRAIPPTFTTNILLLGFGVSYNISIGEIAFPFILAGVSNSWFDPKDDQGNPAFGNEAGIYQKNTKGYDVQLGVKFLVSDQVSINLTGGSHFPINDYLDDVTAGTSDDSYLSFLVGFSISPFFNSDADGDEISNKNDVCPEDKEDIDGFEDEDGCPDFDNDKDRINDNIDLCPNEAEDFDGWEDLDGCPDLDNDEDKIPDLLDRCPNAAEDIDGFEDKDGCPDSDNDNDGIPDALDKCPNEAEVLNGIDDDDGCPDKTAGLQSRLSLSADDIFYPNSAKIKIDGKKYLDEIVLLLSSYPGKDWRIEGHMDSKGTEKFLRALSLDRAKAVLEYFINFGGLNRENFQVYGMGDKFPVADNNTEEGSRRNRRIEIKLVD